jgi:excisionase family DNA binding protein
MSVYMTTKQVMQETGYTRSHICRLIRNGYLRAVRTKQGYLIDMDSLAYYQATRIHASRSRHKQRREPCITVHVAQV